MHVKRIGIDAAGRAQVSRNSRHGKAHSRPLSPKFERKAQRAHEAAHRKSRQPPPPTGYAAATRARDCDEGGETLLGGDDGSRGHHEDYVNDQEEPPILPHQSEQGHSLSRAVLGRLAQDDAEIEEFERKLGIKKGRKSLPKAFKDDGLADLVGHLEGDASDSENETKKRRRDYDDWLSSKRRKTKRALHDTGIQGKRRGDEDSHSVPDDNGDDTDSGGSFCGLDEADSDEDIFRGLESDAASPPPPPEPRQKENPYVAPATGALVAKYVPPSLRRFSGMEDETRSRLRKQMQGQVNRLTDSNILSIVQSIEDMYQKSARGDVTDLLTDAIMSLVCRPESLPDQFFVLMGAFSAAIYKITGSSFGSHLVRRVVENFGAEYDKAGDEVSDRSGPRQAASNTIAFLTQLYVFELVSCKIVFDYMGRLLENLSEINVELLLRVCRMTGRLLRRDDPQALKHVSEVLNKAVSKLGYANVSARTKFMIETIDNLKNAKPKAKGMDSAVVSEHVLRMKKRLGELKSQSRRLDGLAAMGMGLGDVEAADTSGKWWLVGASVPAYRESSERAKGVARNGVHCGAGGDMADDEDMDFVLPDYPKKARAQGLGTTAQIAIFTALMSACGHEHGFRQYANLRLKKDEQLEIARVLVQCVGSETRYNEYYALVGRLACANGRVRFALQDRLWKILRGLGESLFGEEADDGETAESERMKDGRRARNVARFYASLVGSGALSIGILKPLELPEVNESTMSFVEWFMIGLLQECGRGPDEDANIERAFGPARQLPSLAAGTHWFLRKKVRKTRLVGAREAKRLGRLGEKAQAVVQSVAVDAG